MKAGYALAVASSRNKYWKHHHA